MNAQVKTMNALIRRELWEHRGFWMVPAVMSAMMALAIIYFGSKVVGYGPDYIAEMNRELGDSVTLSTIAGQVHGVALLLAGASTAVFVIMMFVTAFYLLDCLYGDRRDRSILFWRSMPVTDVQTVLAKAATALLAGPALTIVVLACAFVVWGSLIALFGLLAGVDYWWLALNPLAWIEALATVTQVALIGGLIVSPFVGWLLLASAWAPRAPFLWATLPIVGISIVERVVFDSTRFLNLIFGHLIHLCGQLFGDNYEGFHIREHLGDIQVVGGVEVSYGVLADSRLWLGVLVAASFIALAIRFRRMRDDAAY